MAEVVPDEAAPKWAEEPKFMVFATPCVASSMPAGAAPNCAEPAKWWNSLPLMFSVRIRVVHSVAWGRPFCRKIGVWF